MPAKSKTFLFGTQSDLQNSPEVTHMKGVELEFLVGIKNPLLRLGTTAYLGADGQHGIV